MKGNDEQDVSNFMVVPDTDEECHCFEAFFNATLNDALVLKTCAVCAGEKMKNERDETLLLSDSSVTEILTHLLEGRGDGREVVALCHLLEINEGGVSCWMYFDCSKCLQWGVLPKGALANDLWIGHIPSQLTRLMISEQLLIAQHYP